MQRRLIVGDQELGGKRGGEDAGLHFRRIEIAGQIGVKLHSLESLLNVDFNYVTSFVSERREVATNTEIRSMRREERWFRVFLRDDDSFRPKIRDQLVRVGEGERSVDRSEVRLHGQRLEWR